MNKRVSPSESAPQTFQTLRPAKTLGRRLANSVLIVFTVVCTAFAVIILLYLLIYVLAQGLPHLNLDFFTQLPTPNGDPGGGVSGAIVGTLILVGLASLIGVPLGLFVGIYLSEFGRGAFAGSVRFLVSVLAGIPSILFGLFAWIAIVIPQQGFSGFSGGVALAIIMIPIVTNTSEEVLHLVPREMREASLALGATESRTILRVVLPAALGGIVTGALLAMARVAGETAPLLMTAFGTQDFVTDLRQPMDALPLRIFTFTESPYPREVAHAYTGSVVLILLILITSFTVRWVTGGFRHRE